MRSQAFIYTILCLASLMKANGQQRGQWFTDSLEVKAGTIMSVSSASYQPFYGVSNKFGVVSKKQLDLSSFAEFTDKIEIGSEAMQLKDSMGSSANFQVGARVFNNTAFTHSFWEQLYLKFSFNVFQIGFGRFEDPTGAMDPRLSSGSLGVSSNAVPIPKLGICTPDYVPVPLTNGFLKFKFSFWHGWFDNDRYMQHAYYHEKSLYVELGKHRWKFFGGVQHFGEWGGSRNAVHTIRSFNGFLDVLFVREADDGTVGTATNGLRPSRAGDQRGLAEAGFRFDGTDAQILGYVQVPFESGEEIDVRNRSFLAGLQVDLVNSRFRPRIVGEFLYTKDMNNFVPAGQRQSYYNNGAYKTGWEYDGRVIGTPLFINRETAADYFDNIQPFPWHDLSAVIPGKANIINNRVIAFHLGGELSFSESLRSRTRLSFTRNYGDLAVPNVFLPFKTQFYGSQGITCHLVNSRLTVTPELNVDLGDLSRNVGTTITITWKII